MYRFDRDLPPLKALRALEAAVRHGSFREAAKELGVTESAVSRQITLLEDHLGISLFERSGRGVKPNGNALELQRSVAQAFELISSTSRGLKKAHGPKHLTVASTTTFCSLWLMPRLKHWNARHPDVSIHMLSDDASPNIDGEQDVSIVLGYENTMGFEGELLFCEEVFPVCSPEYLKRHPEISDIHQLVKHPLMDLHPSHWKKKTWSPMVWEYWLEENGVSSKTSWNPILYTHFHMILNAARESLGIALAWKHLVDADLKQGTLVRPTVLSLTASDRCVYLVVRKSLQNVPEIFAFRKWIADEIAKS